MQKFLRARIKVDYNIELKRYFERFYCSDSYRDPIFAECFPGIDIAPQNVVN